MSGPNFFIVGAPKCGTSALYAYLSEHPNIFLTNPKEPQYFSEDLPRYRLVHSRDDYARLFSRARPEHTRRGEASTSYLFSDVAIPNIRRAMPDAKIIAMLRNPIDMVHAWHSQTILNGDETQYDFEIAWGLQEARMAGIALPKRCRHEALLRYCAWAQFAPQVERLFAHFPPEQRHIILFDDFVQDTQAVYRQTLEFLGLESDNRTHFPKINESQSLRMKTFGNYIENPPPFVRSTANFVKKSLGVNRLGLLDPLKNMNRKTTKRTPISPPLRKVLVDRFQDDVERLSELLDRDLTHWIARDSQQQWSQASGHATANI